MRVRPLPPTGPARDWTSARLDLRERGNWPWEPGTASSPGFFRRPPWRSSGRCSGVTPRRGAAPRCPARPALGAVSRVFEPAGDRCLRPSPRPDPGRAAAADPAARRGGAGPGGGGDPRARSAVEGESSPIARDGRRGPAVAFPAGPWLIPRHRPHRRNRHAPRQGQARRARRARLSGEHAAPTPARPARGGAPRRDRGRGRSPLAPGRPAPRPARRGSEPRPTRAARRHVRLVGSGAPGPESRARRDPGSDLEQADLTGATLKRARLSGLCPLGGVFRRADRGGGFRQGRSQRRPLHRVAGGQADFTEAMLEDASFRDASLRFAACPAASSTARIFPVPTSGAPISPGRMPITPGSAPRASTRRT